MKDKRAREDDNIEDVDVEARTSKKAKSRAAIQDQPSFRGFIWIDFSCAYDILLTILLAVYTESEQAWNMNISEIIECWSILVVYSDRLLDLVLYLL